ncbi:MAG: aspartate carbamoyltransferase catalytic subunit, partial [Bdellovibrionota bacterium]
MSLLGRSFIRSADLSGERIHSFFDYVSELKNEFNKHGNFDRLVQKDHKKVIALLFFEPSTRTRFSFEIAAKRLGMSTTTLDSAASTSLTKGETLIDTIYNICAMKPDALVIRHSGNKEVNECLRDLKIPVINAGDGTDEHPTQALLDAYTIRSRMPLQKAKILFVGDIRHSRVAHSDRRLFERLGLEVGFCSPESLAPVEQEWSRARDFKTLNEGLEWCDVVMGLRLQQERYSGEEYIDLNSYIQSYRLDYNSLQSLKPKGLIMHPGPFVPEVDLSSDVLKDPRCVIHEQVENGV